MPRVFFPADDGAPSMSARVTMPRRSLRTTESCASGLIFCTEAATWELRDFPTELVDAPIALST